MSQLKKAKARLEVKGGIIERSFSSFPTPSSRIVSWSGHEGGKSLCGN